MTGSWIVMGARQGGRQDAVRRRAGRVVAAASLVALLTLAGGMGAAPGSAFTTTGKAGGTPVALPACARLLQHVPAPRGGLGMQGGVRAWLDPPHHRLRALAYLVVGNGTGAPVVRVALRSLAIERGLVRVLHVRVANRAVAATLDPGALHVPLPCRLRRGASVILTLDLIVHLPDEQGHGRWRLASDGAGVVASGWLPQPAKGIHPWLAVQVMPPTRGPVVIAPVERQEDAVVALVPGDLIVERTVGTVRVRVLRPPGATGDAAAAAVFDLLDGLLPWLEARLGPMERTELTVALVRSTGQAWTWPGIIWLPDTLDPAWVRIYLTHEVVHEWFGGIVTGDAVLQPVAMEAPAELVARLYLDRFRACTCPGLRLDLPRSAYGSCFYDAVYLDAALRLEGVRRQLGDERFWAAVRRVLDQHRGETIGVGPLLQALGRPHLFDGRRPPPPHGAA